MSQERKSKKSMFKINPSDVFLGIIVMLMIIPRTRSFIQQNLHKAIGKINPPTAIEKNEQKTIELFEGQLKAINTNRDINFENLQGKVIFINFWATWCPPCVAEMASLQKLYDSHKGKAVFLFITSDSANTTNAFLRKNNYTMPCYNLESSLPKELSHKSYPTTYIIDTKGKIVINKTGGADWNTKQIKTIINQLVKE